MKDAIRATQIFPGTLRDTPAEAGTPGHQFLLRAGFIRQIASGLFTICPLGMRVLWKIEKIVRQEMNEIGGLEVNFPILQPKELWEKTGRWSRYKNDGIMFFLKDRKGQSYGLAPTAEELATLLALTDLSSHAQMPINIWQMDWKFRDELRPRMGLIRGRLFRMKDAYTFDVDAEGMRKSYDLHRRAYTAMFSRMGFRFISVQADSGAIGGQGSAEFMAISEDGEDVLLTCDNCDYGANQEKAESLLDIPDCSAELKSMHKEPTPNIRTVEELEANFHLSAAQMVKTIIYVTDGERIAVCCRGDLEINEVKLANVLAGRQVAIADETTVVEVTGAPVGFAGPIGLKGARLVFDCSVEPVRNFLCGCNEVDVHMLDVNLGRDIPKPERFYDVHNARAGDRCAACMGGHLQESKGIEVGHIFMLQQGYAEKMGVTFLGPDGQRHVPWMGCYGVGTTRCLQGLAEQYHDDDGIKWPSSVAPYQFVIVPTNSIADSVQLKLAEKLFEVLRQRGAEVVLDDREIGFGAKMKDALLLGYPQIIVVGRDAEQDMVELQNRTTGERVALSYDKLLAKI
jgi:prolyl-tRNA synthetase